VSTWSLDQLIDKCVPCSPPLGTVPRWLSSGPVLWTDRTRCPLPCFPPLPCLPRPLAGFWDCTPNTPGSLSSAPSAGLSPPSLIRPHLCAHCTHSYIPICTPGPPRVGDSQVGASGEERRGCCLPDGWRRATLRGDIFPAARNANSPG
jgi:hypothetical protein